MQIKKLCQLPFHRHRPSRQGRSLMPGSAMRMRVSVGIVFADVNGLKRINDEGCQARFPSPVHTWNSALR